MHLSQSGPSSALMNLPHPLQCIASPVVVVMVDLRGLEPPAISSGGRCSAAELQIVEGQSLCVHLHCSPGAMTRPERPGIEPGLRGQPPLQESNLVPWVFSPVLCQLS